MIPRRSHSFVVASSALIVVLALWFRSQHLENTALVRSERPLGTKTPPVVVKAPSSHPLLSQALSGSVPGAPAASQSRPRGSVPQEVEDFNHWVNRFRSAAPDQRAAMHEEGLTLAKARLRVMADWVQSDPKRAFQNAVSAEVRQSVPASVGEHLETLLTGKGDLAVIAAWGNPEQSNPLPPVMRTLNLNGETYQAFTYGAGDQWVTHSDLSFYGLVTPNDAATIPFSTALGKPSRLIALNESPARLLEDSELRQLTGQRSQQGRSDPICSVSNLKVTRNNEETALEFEGSIHSFCGKVDAQLWLKARIAAMGADTPVGALASWDVAASPLTEGRKRLLLMRPVWGDYQGGMSTNDALVHWQNFSNYMFEMSYGKLVLAGLGKGSDVTPAMLLPGLVATYDNDGLGKLYQTCKEVAQSSYGYDLTQYDYLYVCTDSKPAASYAGLAFVGGVGFHLANSYWGPGVASHEFGHNLGLNHAHFWDTKAKSIIGDGQNVEYGDSNDPMGGGENPNQYNSRYKNYLGWIKESDIIDLNVAKSGTYRLYASDLAQGTGVRGVKFARNGGQNYWLNFRQRKADKRALMNGVQLLWTGNGNEGSYLLDVRLKGNADDNAIVIGRTFSDAALGFRFTPIGKGNTFPESMDVVVSIGNIATNQPPLVTLTASATLAGLNQNLNFQANATDPNGDALAYFWEFGDGDYTTDNKAVVSHRFANAGEYIVTCTVSDMRGGEVRKSVLIRVGSPGTFQIRGHVLDTKNRPLPGMKVFVDATHFGVSDSDGSYAIVNLPAGGYSIDAIESVSGSLSFAHPYFENPVVVGPDRDAIDLVGIPGLLLTQTPLITKKAAAWRYLDTGVDQGVDWVNPAFNDATWKTGAAVLGYGQAGGLGNEATVISFGPDPNNKYPTAYFRKSFTVKNPLSYTNYTMEVLRDDGVVVYLNGKEIYRNNLPPTGDITYGTHASDTVEPDSYLAKTIANTELVSGVNWIAAEVHQATAASSDLTFDLAFTGIAVSNATGLSLVYLQQPADQTRYTNGQTVAMTANVFSAAPVTRVDFYADGSKIGESAAMAHGFSWSEPPAGTHALRCVGVLGGIQVTSPVVTIVVAQPLPDFPQVELLASGGSWRYLAKSSAAPSTWSQLSFDDSAWSNGIAKLGFGRGDEATLINGGPSNTRYTTIYFRSKFVVEDAAGMTNLIAQLKRDDGAVVYLNGVEVLRDNIGPGAVSYTTLATNASDNGSVFYAEALDDKALNALVVGTNLVAVEVHQTSASSGDLAFDFALSGQARLRRDRGCYLASPAPASSVPADAPLTLKADVIAGGVLGVQKVSFFVDGQKIAEDLVGPFTTTWTHPNSGHHLLKAIALDSQGDSMESAEIPITVIAPAAGIQWISFGDFWKYLDDGSDQGTNWIKRSFNDQPWRSGPARLGYGFGNQIETVLSVGTNSALKNITAYFRKSFVISNPTDYSGIRLLLGRNDGAAVYLNGVEVLRDNLPTARLSYNTLAVTKISGTGDATPLRAVLSTQLLVAGTNVIAVELHQQSATSTDASFDLALSGLTPAPADVALYLVNPGARQRFNTPASVTLNAEVLGDGSLPDKVKYFSDGLLIGESATYPYAFTWVNAPAGEHALKALSVIAGQSVESPAVVITVGPPPPPIAPILDRLAPLASAWKYWDAPTGVRADWKKIGSDETGWKSGNGRLGFGLDGEFTTLTPGRMAYYFRRSINITNPAAYSQLVFQLARDDGAVVYLNGHELYRSNMPDGAIGPDTPAVTPVFTPEESIYYETVVPITGTGLTRGTNVVAVEVHQQPQANGDRVDLAFDLQVLGVGTTERRVSLLSPALSTYTQAGFPVQIEAAVQSGSSASVDHIDFYADGHLVGSAPASPWVFSWEDAALGAHQLVARAWFGDATSMDSASLPVVVSPFLVSPLLIASNGVWRYNDKGLNLGTAWRGTNYDDSAWSSGPARLGYGDDGETTAIGFGANANAKFITTYFRNSFLLSNDLVVTNLSFRYQRDDGLAVYFNGKELFRNNLAANPSFTTTAIVDVSGLDEQTWYSTNITITSTILGTNVLAAEVHQSRATSSDLGFTLELVGNGYLKAVPVLHPRLEIQVLADGSVEFAWPSGATGVRLYSSPNIDLPFNAWQPVAEAASVVTGKLRVRITNLGDSAFFRLFGN